MNEKSKKIVKILQDNGFQAVYAGGCVRDMLLNLKPKDIDIATSATPDEVEKIFKHTIPVGKQFGIIIVLMDGEEFEVATFRNDSEGSDGRRPDSVTFSSMEEDAKRRDLTINSMFFDPITEEVFDFVGGKEDLWNGTIRFVGDPEKRIEEDKLRILRAIRFKSRFEGFGIENKSSNAIFKNAHRVMGNVSVERIKEEIEKGMLSDKPSEYFTDLSDYHILKYIFPEIEALWDSPQSKKWHGEGNVWIHTMLVLDNTRKRTNDLMALWGALFHDVGKPANITIGSDGHIGNRGHEKTGADMWDDIAPRFRFSREERKIIRSLIADHMKVHVAMDMKKSTLRKLISEEHFDRLIAMSMADSESSIPEDKEKQEGKFEGVEFLLNFSKEKETVLPDKFVTGRDLIQMGFEPGHLFKDILLDVFDKQLDDQFETREQALEYVVIRYVE